MIIVKLRGGLGNQLFEYSFGRAIQEKTNQPLILDISDYKESQPQREYELGHFRLGKNVTTDDTGQYNKTYKGGDNLITHIEKRFFSNFIFKKYQKNGIYIWGHGSYKNVCIDYSKKTLMINGYWQSKSYFSSVTDQLAEEIVCKDKMSLSSEQIAEKIAASNSVGIHIRRTDFLSNPKYFYSCSADYYKKAINVMEKKVSQPTFFVFSDDINGVKSWFSSISNNVVFIEGKRKTYEDFCLFSQCKNLIIANSTFSWWPAFLKKDPSSFIIAPSKWWRADRDPASLIADKWFLIDPE